MPTELQKQHQEELREKREKLMARKSRTRRLIQHGAIAEAFIQGAEDMEPETFKEALQELLSPIGRRIPSEPERIDTKGLGKEMRPSFEGSLSKPLVQCLSREGYSPEDLASLLEQIKRHSEKIQDGGYIRVKSLADPSKIILVKRTDNVLEVV
mgnify:CR=1 FL=1